MTLEITTATTGAFTELAAFAYLLSHLCNKISNFLAARNATGTMIRSHWSVLQLASTCANQSSCGGAGYPRIGPNREMKRALERYCHAYVCKSVVHHTLFTISKFGRCLTYTHWSRTICEQVLEKAYQRGGIAVNIRSGRIWCLEVPAECRHPTCWTRRYLIWSGEVFASFASVRCRCLQGCMVPRALFYLFYLRSESLLEFMAVIGACISVARPWQSLSRIHLVFCMCSWLELCTLELNFYNRLATK